MKASDLGELYAPSLLFGFSYGAASTLFPATVADVFGREHAGTIAGLLFATAGSLAALGPVAAGLDRGREARHLDALGRRPGRRSGQHPTQPYSESRGTLPGGAGQGSRSPRAEPGRGRFCVGSVHQ